MRTPNAVAATQADNGATTGYEAKLWAMVDTLRGSMAAAEYISDAFNERHAEVLVNWGKGTAEDKLWRYGVPPKGNANFAWVQHMVHHLAPKGRAGFVLVNGLTSIAQSGEGAIRKNLIEAELVDCMAALPGQLAERTHRELSDKEFARVEDGHHARRTEENHYVNVPGFCRNASLREVRRHGHALTPGRYVGVEPQEDDDGPFEEKVSRLFAELREQQAQGGRLDAAINEYTAALGFEDRP